MNLDSERLIFSLTFLSDSFSISLIKYTKVYYGIILLVCLAVTKMTFSSESHYSVLIADFRCKSISSKTMLKKGTVRLISKRGG